MASLPPAESLPREENEGASDLLLALALFTPALLLGWPGALGPLQGVFAATELTATGYAVLFALPAALLFALRRFALPATPSARLALLGLAGTLVWALARPLFGAPSDPNEAARALGAFTLIALFLAAATRLGERGRSLLSWGLCAATVLLLTPPLWSKEPGLSGALGNSGELSGAALAGALFGAFGALRPKNQAAVRFALLLAPGLFVLHAAMAPSYVGAVAFALVLAVGAVAKLASGEKKSALALAAGVAFSLSLVAAFALERRSSHDDSSFQAEQESALRDDAPPSASPDLGGFFVRQSIWKRTLAMSAAQPLFGHGLGQFSVHFPPYRDVQEIEASSYGRQAGVETEVEHPHQDVLVVSSELGLLGLGAWLLFLSAAAFACWRALRRGGTDAAFAAAGLGVLLHAMANATLTANPTAAMLGAASLGAAWPRMRSAHAGGRVVPVALALLLFGLLPQAWNAVQHGRSIARLAHGNPSANTQIDAWEEALRALPESSIALSARARLAAALQQTPGSIEKLWRKTTTVRPHRVEALIQLGVQRARADDLDEASQHFGHANELDPAHPVAASNLARVLFLLGRSDEGEALLDQRASYGRPVEAAWLENLAVDLLARCDGASARSLFERAEAEEQLRALGSGDFAWAQSGLLRGEGKEADADAWAMQAHRLWAAEHLAGGRASDAVRSYRQAVRIARDTVPPEGPPDLLREYAEALIEAGRDEEARRVLDLLQP